MVYIFKTLQGDVQDWLLINSALLYHQELNQVLHEDSGAMLINLVHDLISIQVLYLLTTVMQMVVKGEMSSI